MTPFPSILVWLTGFCTVLYLAKLSILLFAGGGDGDSDLGLDGSSEDGIDPGFKLLTTQTMLAFGMGFGWLSLALVRQAGMSYPAAMGLGALNGFFLMWLTLRVMASLRRLNTPPRANRPEPGALGRAYTQVDAQSGPAGLVHIFDARTHQAREYRGVADGGKTIVAHAEVEVVRWMGDAVVVRAIEPLTSTEEVSC